MNLFKILAFSAIGLLVAANLLQINTNLKLRTKISQLNSGKILLENKLYLTETEAQLIGTEIKFMSFDSLQPASLQTGDSAYKLLAFFSWKDCSSCLTEETLRWQQLHRKHRILVRAVCIDGDSRSVDNYRKHYTPGFSVVHDTENVFETTKAERTPLVLLLDKKNKVILAHLAEVENDANRERFYYQVSQILSLSR